VTAVAIPVALRAALIWRGEVMGDRTCVAQPITLGASSASTFVIPDLSLPAEFAIIRPGNRGYLLTLSAGMRGTICIEGEKRDVYEFVRRGGEGGDGAAGEFRATPIGPRDWGVIDLDESGHYQLFFQFVPAEQPIGLGPIALGLLLPALAFSLVLHTIIVLATFQFDDETDDVVYPGPDDLTGSYLISRLTAPPEPPPPPPSTSKGAEAAASAQGDVKKIKSATKGESGASGGKGETERARDPDAKDVPPDAPPPPPEVAFMTKENRQVLDTLLQTDVRTQLGKFTGLPGAKKAGGLGYGKGTGTGVGDELGGTGTTRGGKGNGPGRRRLGRGRLRQLRARSTPARPARPRAAAATAAASRRSRWSAPAPPAATSAASPRKRSTRS
jgi:hypothetical protein